MGTNIGGNSIDSRESRKADLAACLDSAQVASIAVFQQRSSWGPKTSRRADDTEVGTSSVGRPSLHSPL